jgi:hypothetical protein
MRIRGQRLFAAIVALGWLASAPGPREAHAQLIAEYKFNETSGTVAHDSVGGVNGTLHGGASFVPNAGAFGGAVQLDAATNSYVDMGNNFGFLTGDFSLSLWVKVAPNANFPDPNSGVVAGKHHNGFVNGYVLATGTSGAVAFYASDPGPSQGLVSPVTINNNQWHNVIGVYHAGANGLKDLYIDGAYLGSVHTQNTVQVSDADFIVGGSDYFGTNRGLFTGSVGDLRLYSNALTATDALTIYQTGTAVPEPGPLGLAGVAAAVAVVWRWLLRGRAGDTGGLPTSANSRRALA